MNVSSSTNPNRIIQSLYKLHTHIPTNLLVTSTEKTAKKKNNKPTNVLVISTEKHKKKREKKEKEMHLKIHLEREELPDRSQDMWRERERNENGENEKKKKKRIGFFFSFFY